MIDVFVPVAEKDYLKIPFVLRSLLKFVTTPIGKVHISSPTGFVFSCNEIEVVSHKDSDIISIDLSRIKYRPMWIYQQLLKLGQRVTETEYFLITDSDVLLNKPLSFFENDKPVMVFARDQDHYPYWNFNKTCFGFGKVHNYSFLSELTLYNRKLLNEMIDSNFGDFNGFFDHLVTVLEPDCYPAESELYGSWIYK